MTPENDKWITLKRMVREEKTRMQFKANEGCHIKKGAMCQVLSWMDNLEKEAKQNGCSNCPNLKN